MKESPVNVKLAPGDKAPDFDLPLAGGGRITLEDLAGESALIWFYPAAGTSLCTRQARDLRDHAEELTASGARILGISPDPIDKVEEFVEKEGLPFAMAADEGHAVMEAYGAWGEKNMYGVKKMGVIRSSFVIDAHGVLTAVKYRVGTPKHVEFVRKALSLDTQE